jgi:hypothetical protein
VSGKTGLSGNHQATITRSLPNCRLLLGWRGWVAIDVERIRSALKALRRSLLSTIASVGAQLWKVTVISVAGLLFRLALPADIAGLHKASLRMPTKRLTNATRFIEHNDGRLEKSSTTQRSISSLLCRPFIQPVETFLAYLQFLALLNSQIVVSCSSVRSSGRQLLRANRYGTTAGTAVHVGERQ